jgi:hypothetical protein
VLHCLVSTTLSMPRYGEKSFSSCRAIFSSNEGSSKLEAETGDEQTAHRLCETQHLESRKSEKTPARSTMPSKIRLKHDRRRPPRVSGIKDFRLHIPSLFDAHRKSQSRYSLKMIDEGALIAN